MASPKCSLLNHLERSPNGRLTRSAKSSKELREWLEEHYREGLTETQAIRLAIETLLEVVESEKSIELCIIRADNLSRFVPTEDIQVVVGQINKEKEEAEAAKKMI